MESKPATPKRDITERTFEFAVRVVKFCEALGVKPGARRSLSGQLLRSGTSVGANVEEAQAAESRDDFIHKMTVALKESRESRYWLRVAIAAELCRPDLTAALLEESCALVRILTTIVKRAKENHPTEPTARRKER